VARLQRIFWSHPKRTTFDWNSRPTVRLPRVVSLPSISRVRKPPFCILFCSYGFKIVINFKQIATSVTLTMENANRFVRIRSDRTNVLVKLVTFWHRMVTIVKKVPEKILFKFFSKINDIHLGGCKFELVAPSGFVTSPGYPDEYPNKKECVWHFVTTPGHRLLLVWNPVFRCKPLKLSLFEFFLKGIYGFWSRTAPRLFVRQSGTVWRCQSVK